MTEELVCQKEIQDSPLGLRRTGREGFTIVEVLVAIIILSVGLLGMAGTTMLMVKQTTLADVTTERAAALQGTIEQLRSIPFDSVGRGAESVGHFEVTWTVSDGGRWKAVEIVTTGPGLAPVEGFPTLKPSVSDTFEYRIITR